MNKAPRTRVVVDTNILFSALLHKEAKLRECILTDPVHRFFAPRFVIVELKGFNRFFVP